MFCVPMANMTSSSPSKHTIWRSEPTGNALPQMSLAERVQLLQLGALDEAVRVRAQTALRDAVDLWVQPEDTMQRLLLSHSSLHVELQLVDDSLKISAGKQEIEVRSTRSASCMGGYWDSKTLARSRRSDDVMTDMFFLPSSLLI